MGAVETLKAKRLICAALLAAMTFTAGCSSARKTVYLPDGRGGYMTACDSDGWQKCYRKATKICKPRNYEVLEKQRNPKVMFYRCGAGG
jgi:hypothetical protein